MADEKTLCLSDAIEKKLNAVGKCLKDIDPRTQNQLEKIEHAIQSESSLREKAEGEARAHEISIASIAKASGVSRATFYNKPVLKEYVESARDGEDSDSPKAESELLAKRLEHAEEVISKMQKRDGALVVMAAENERLRKRVEILEGFVTAMPNDIRQDFDARGIIIPFAINQL